METLQYFYEMIKMVLFEKVLIVNGPIENTLKWLHLCIIVSSWPLFLISQELYFQYHGKFAQFILSCVNRWLYFQLLWYLWDVSLIVLNMYCIPCKCIKMNRKLYIDFITKPIILIELAIEIEADNTSFQLKLTFHPKRKISHDT